MGKNSGARAQARAQENAGIAQSEAAVQVAQIQSDASDRASAMQQATALEVAQLHHDATLGASHAAAGGAIQAAGIAADATLQSTEMNLAAQQEAVERFELAADEAIALQDEQFALAQDRLSPYADIGRDQIQAVNDAGTLDGFAQRLSAMADSDVYSELFNERMEVADARLAASGQNRSGAAAQEAAELSLGTLLGLDSTLYGRQVNNVNFGRGVATEQNALGSNYANAVGNLETGTALNAGNTIVNTALANGQLATNSAIAQGNFITQGANAAAGYQLQGAALAGNALMSGTNAAANGIINSAYHTGQGIMGSANALAQGQIGAANARAQGQQNTMNNIMAAGQLAASFFSDPTMKENMEKVGEYGPLNIYEWDWKDEYKDEFGTEMNVGFNADEVEQLYPQYVETQGRKKKIDYEGLMAELQEAA